VIASPEVGCPYCGESARRVDGAVIYPHRADLAARSFFQCAPCDAYVGTHKGNGLPFGRLANRELRAARSRLHALFDPLWNRGGCDRAGRRRDLYERLAEVLRIPVEECHIGDFDLSRAAQAERVLRRWRP